MIWESETTQTLHVCVYGTCESQRERERARRAEGEQDVTGKCMGTNATEWRDIKVGICIFSAQRSSSFMAFCDLLSP